MKNLLDVKIRELGFSGRTYNCLRRRGLETVGDILYFCKANPAKLLKIGLGFSASNEVMEIINKLDSRLHVGMTEEEIDAFLKDTLEVKEYNAYKKLITNKEIFFNTQLIELGIVVDEYFPCCVPKTLFNLLHEIAVKRYEPKFENILRKIIEGLDFDIIYFGMSTDEICELIVPDNIIEKINSKIMKENPIFEFELSEEHSDEKLLDSVETDIKSLRDNIDEKEKIVSRLNELLQEKERLIELNKDLDIKIDNIIGKLKKNYGYKH